MNLATKYAGLALLALAYVTPTLAAAPLGPDIERFRAQCRAEYAHLRGPGQRANVVNHVIACVGEKVRALVSAEAAVPVATSKPLTFVEFTPWLIQAPRGPAAAKGVVYFVGGFEAGGMLDGFRITPYFLKRLNDEGWDVIGAKAPRNEHVRFGAEIASGGAASIVRRVKEEGISVSQAAKDAGVHETTVYGWLGAGATSAPSWGEFSRLRKQNKELFEVIGELTIKLSQTQKKN